VGERVKMMKRRERGRRRRERKRRTVRAMYNKYSVV
jgi:hypothetical protein